MLRKLPRVVYDDSSLIKIERKIFRLMEEALHADKSSQDLITGSAPQIIADAIEYYQKQGVWKMYDYVIMPNHLHLFFGEKNGSLHDILSNFKHWTTRKINKVNKRVGDKLW